MASSKKEERVATIIVTLQDGVAWHANSVVAIATSLGLRAAIEAVVPQSGLIAEKAIICVVARDHVAPDGKIIRHARAFPATEVFSGLPGVVRIEMRDEPTPSSSAIPPSSAIPLASDICVAGEFLFTASLANRTDRIYLLNLFPPVECAVDFFQCFVGDVRIDLRGGNAAMAQEFLHRA
jgi:hypothetical protein